jgi:two-component system cell cycle sensor histidine kinase/response regulator CckA
MRRRRDKALVALLISEHASQSLQQLIVQCGPERHEVLVAESTEHARELLTGGRIDMVVVDVGGRDDDGWNTLESLRNLETGAAFIALGDSTDDDVVLRAARFGAEEHLAKADLSVALLERALRYARERKRHIAEQLRVDSKMMRAQRMEAVGHLAASIAHDVNNMLTVIHSFSSFVDETLLAADPAKEDMAQVLEATHKAAGLTHQLLAIAHRQPRDVHVVDVNQLVADMQSMLRRVTPTEIELRMKLAPEPNAARIVPDQLEQLLVNLVLNACDAMPDGGRLDIATSSTIIDEDLDATPYGELASDTYAVLTVSDNGLGMSEKVQEQIFEPFFTTKQDGDGSGLGLSTCRAFVAAAGGHVHVKSTKGQGSSFIIYLPRLPPAALLG